MKDYVVPFSPDLRKEINRLSTEHDSLYLEKQFSKIPEIYKRQYELIRESEKELPGILRHHKGAPLYNWGQFLINQNTPESISEGSEKLLLSHIEDLIDSDTVGQAKNLPAYGEISRRFPHFNDIILKLIEITQRLIDKEIIPKDPLDVLREAGYSEIKKEKEIIKTEIVQIEERIHTWLDEKGPKNRRVFIGGSYRNIAVLTNISDIIQKLGYVPIMACECNFLSESPYDKHIHDTSIMLLKGCSYAIFEITISNGHLMEIERAKDFEDLKVILVYQSMDPASRPSITRMLMTTGFEKTGYLNFIQLTASLNNFLK